MNDTDIEHRQVQANGISFHVAVSGAESGPAVLCLHGFPEGWMSWRAVMRLMPDARIYAPTLRGYPGSDRPRSGYDVFTLIEDVRGLVEALGLERPLLVGHDWGGELAWIFGHRYSPMVRRMVIVNGTHPKTLLRAALRFEDFTPLRIPWLALFEIPWLPEFLLTTSPGRRFLRLSFLLREGTKGTMDRATVDEIVDRFRKPEDLRYPIEYYRRIVATIVSSSQRRRLDTIYATPVTAPVTMVHGLKDEALTAKIAMKSGRDAGCEVDWRPLEGVGHFVDLEAPDRLAAEIRRALALD